MLYSGTTRRLARGVSNLCVSGEKAPGPGWRYFSGESPTGAGHSRRVMLYDGEVETERPPRRGEYAPGPGASASAGKLCVALVLGRAVGSEMLTLGLLKLVLSGEKAAEARGEYEPGPGVSSGGFGFRRGDARDLGLPRRRWSAVPHEKAGTVRWVESANELLKAGLYSPGPGPYLDSTRSARPSSSKSSIDMAASERVYQNKDVGVRVRGR